MCRMMGVVGARATSARLCAAFRAEAPAGRVAKGAPPGHKDGWGIAHMLNDGRLAHAGISTRDAAHDSTYPQAVDRVAHGRPRGAVLAHVRKASLGTVTLANTHPFIEEGYAFAHNGTVFDIASPGENDSRILFARLLAELSKGSAVDDAITTLSRWVDDGHTYTSLTLLVTDGASLWGLRRVGNHPELCAPDACAADYYTLGHARLPDGSVIVSQEHELLGIEGWTPIADGDIVHVDAAGKIQTRRAV